MSWLDDFDLGSIFDFSGGGEDLTSAPIDYSGLFDTGPSLDFSGLFDTGSQEPSFPDLPEYDYSNLLPASVVDEPDGVTQWLQGLNSPDPTIFDSGGDNVQSPIATEQAWERLNTMTDPLIAPSEYGNSAPSILSALTDRGALINDSTNGSWGAYGYPAPTTDSTNGSWGAYGYPAPTTESLGPPSEYIGTGSDTFNPETGVVKPGAGLPQGWWANMLKYGVGAANMLAALPKKSNLASGIGALGMLGQMAGAYDTKKGKAPTPTQIGTKGMSWNSASVNKRAHKASGGDVGGGDSGAYPRGPRGPLGLLAGPTSGQADRVPINASHGEYIFDADTVSAIGDGNTEAGSAKLDKMRQNIRRHKRSAPPSKIPPKAKNPMAYMKGAK